MTKTLLREKYREKRKQFFARSIDKREEISKSISEKIAHRILSNQWNNILLYFPLKNEIDILHLLSSLANLGKSPEKFSFYLPVVIGDGKMIAKPVEIEKKGNWQINPQQLEKQSPLMVTQPKILQEEIKSGIHSNYFLDIVLTPGLAFGDSGHRLGYGGGYYDRFFTNNQSQIGYKVGVFLENQRVPNYKGESHDIKLDAIQTEINWRVINDV